MQLTTDRLILREFEERDWEAVHEYASDPEVVRYMNWGPNAEDETRNFIQRAIAKASQDPRTGYDFAAVLKEEDSLIGTCGIYLRGLPAREAEIGYCFNPRFWARGYATEAAKGLLAFLFGTLGLHRIFAMCDVENLASARVLEKLGMRREAHFREHLWVKGRWRDSFLYAVLDHEWERLKAEETS